MKEKLENTKGITLIALVITIIVLLILAIVSIKLIWDGGIIQHSNNAVTEYKTAQTNELEQLNTVEEQMKQYGENNNSKWWELTDNEKNIITPTEEEIGSTEYHGCDLTIAKSKNVQDWENINKIIAILITKQNNIGGIIIYDIDTYTAIVYFTDYIYTDEASGGDLDEIKEINKWYTYGGSGFEQIDKYDGPCPVKLSDFEYIESGLENLVQRIIESFNQ